MFNTIFQLSCDAIPKVFLLETIINRQEQEMIFPVTRKQLNTIYCWRVSVNAKSPLLRVAVGDSDVKTEPDMLACHSVIDCADNKRNCMYCFLNSQISTLGSWEIIQVFGLQATAS